MDFRLSTYHYTAALKGSEKLILFSSRSGMGKIISTSLYELLQEGYTTLIPTALFLSLCEAELLVDKEEEEETIVKQRLLHSDYLTIPFLTSSSRDQITTDYDAYLSPGIARCLKAKASNILCIHLLLNESTSTLGLQLLDQRLQQDFKASFQHIVYSVVIPSSFTDASLFAAWLKLLRPVEINFDATSAEMPATNHFAALLRKVALYESGFINPAENRRYLAINHFFNTAALQTGIIRSHAALCSQELPALTVRNIMIPPVDEFLQFVESPELTSLIQEGIIQQFLPKQTPVLRCGEQSVPHLSMLGFTDLCGLDSNSTPLQPASLMQDNDHPCTTCRLLPVCGGYWVKQQWTDIHCPPFKKYPAAVLQYAFTLKKTAAV